jgi:hypothetical protein
LLQVVVFLVTRFVPIRLLLDSFLTQQDDPVGASDGVGPVDDYDARDV